MAARRHAIEIGLVLALVGAAAAAPSRSSDPEIDRLAKALPRGWQLAVGNGELVIRHLAPVRVSGVHLDTPHTQNVYVPASASSTSREIALALRYRVEPKWSADKLSKAQAGNVKIYAALNALRVRHRIAEIPHTKGRPSPATADEQTRLAAYEAEYARTIAQIVAAPRCTIGDVSVFDDATTYSQLQLMIDPPGAMREAYAIVELVKRRCR